MITHILVPLDGSDASEQALAPAKELADRFGARVTLLTVMIRYPNSRIHVPQMDDRSVESGKAYLAGACGRHNLGEGIELKSTLGMPAEAIIEFAASASVDLIVMSTHGTTGTTNLGHTLGSVAWKVLQHAPCAVYLVPVRFTASKS